MEMSWPYPLHSKYDPANDYTNIDYSMTSPLVADGSNFPCKGYQNDRPIATKVTYEAGSTYNMSLAGSAMHGGGSCQLSLSYDNGATFRVIKSMIGGCPLTTTYDFTIPSFAPDGTALFAWSWVNLQGNREFYMNCAEVDIVGSTTAKRDFTSFDDLPFIWKANLAGLNACTTTENVVVIYPDPGPDVIYGTGASSSSASTIEADTCDAPKPFGQTYEYLGDSVDPTTETLSVENGAVTTAATDSTFKATTLVTSTKVSNSMTPSATTFTSDEAPATSISSTASKSSTDANPSSSDTSVESSAAGPGRLDPANNSSDTCPPDVIVTVYADVSQSFTSLISSLTGTTVSTVVGFSDGGSSTILIISTATSSSVTAATLAASNAASADTSAGTSALSSANPEVTEGYATGDLTTYLPCVPGTFICTTNTTWVTCDQTMYSNGSTAWVYDESRSVAAGTMCVPNLSPYSSQTDQYAQQADAPSGYYRDDRIAAAQPYGACSDEGSIECSDGGSQFLICDNGAWVLMGDVAAGTMCEDGQIVAS